MVIYSLGALLLGAQLLCMGFLAELLISYHVQNSQRRTYSICEQINTSPAQLNSTDEIINGGPDGFEAG